MLMLVSTCHDIMKGIKLSNQLKVIFLDGWDDSEAASESSVVFYVLIKKLTIEKQKFREKKQC